MQSDETRSGTGPDEAASAADSGAADEAPATVPAPPAAAADDAPAPDAPAPADDGATSQPSALTTLLSSRRNLITVGAAIGIVALLLGWWLIGGRSGEPVGESLGFERNGLLLLSSSRSDGRVDLYVVGLDEDPSRENLVLRDVRLRRIDTPNSSEIFTGTYLGIPVRDGFLVHVETRDDEFAVMFVGTGGEDSTVELFDSRRGLSVAYAPAVDRLLVRESGDGTDRCYQGTSQEPVSRIGSGDACLLGLDGTIAVLELRDERLEVEFYDPTSDDVTSITLDDVADSERSFGRLSWLTNLWNDPTFFAYVAKEGRTGWALVHLDPRTGDEIYRSPTFDPDDTLLFAGGLTVGALLRDEFVTMQLLTAEGSSATPVADGPVVFARALRSGGIVFATADRQDSQGDWKDRSLDINLFLPGAEEPELLSERVGAWYVLDTADQTDLLLLDRRDVALFDLTSRESRDLIDSRDLGDIFSVQRHVEGGLYVLTSDDDGWRLDSVAGDEPWTVVSRWNSLDAFHVDTASGRHVVVGREASGDDVTLAVAETGDRRPQRVDRAEGIGALYIAGPGRLIYSAKTSRDDEVRVLDIAAGDSETLHRGDALVAAGLERNRDRFLRNGLPPVREQADLDEDCAENYRGTITGATRLELTFEPGEVGCWRWDVSGLTDPIAWLHASELYGYLEVLDRTGVLTWSAATFDLFDAALDGALVQPFDVFEDAGPWFLYFEAFTDRRASGTLETGDATLGLPTSQVVPYASGCEPSVGTERAAQCLLENLREVEFFDFTEDWASLQPALSSVRTVLGLIAERDTDRYAELLVRRGDLAFVGCQNSIRVGFGQSCFFRDSNSRVVEIEVNTSSFATSRFGRILEW